MSKYAQSVYAIKNREKYMGKGNPFYRSSWEYTFMQFCDNNPNILKWASEAIKIPYKNPFTGKNTIYVPDFFIVYVDAKGNQHAELIEIKPSNQAIKEKVGRSKNNQAHFILNQFKWAAAETYCKQNGIKFRIITENDIYHSGKR